MIPKLSIPFILTTHLSLSLALLLLFSLAACSLIMSIQAVADGTGNMQLTRQLALVTINLCEQHGSTPHIVFALLSFALVLWSEGRNSECSVAGERAMSLFEAFGEKAKPFTARVYYLVSP